MDGVAEVAAEEVVQGLRRAPEEEREDPVAEPREEKRNRPPVQPEVVRDEEGRA
jgi:hypothetical protein